MSAATASVKRLITPAYQLWNEAEAIADPLKKASSPRVLVRRRESSLVGSRGEELVYLPGQPAISLFTGAGGMDLGIEAAGFCTLVQHEWSADACATLIANRPRAFRHAALIQGDIRETPTSMLLAEAGLRVGEAALVCGGPPCQGFSLSNSNRGKGHDERNDLVFHFLRIVRESQPRFFVMENVPGFLTFPGEVDGLTYPEMFCRRAFDAYYELVYGLLDAVEYGVPQYRCRFICMGTRRDLFEIEGALGSLPAPSHFSPDDLNTLERLRLDVNLFGVSPEAEHLAHAPGVRYFPDRPFLKPPGPNHDGKRSQTYIDFYREIEAREPDRIVRAPISGEVAA